MHMYRAVEILRKCAETDKIDFLIARDKKAQENFRRLSQTIVLNSKRTGKPVIHNAMGKFIMTN